MSMTASIFSRRKILALLLTAVSGGFRNGDSWADQPPDHPADSPGATTDWLRERLRTIEENGKGEIRLPAGVFALSRGAGRLAGLTVPSGTTIRGAGRDLTTLKLGDGEFGHVINAPYGNFTLSDITIDGNRRGRANQRGHNIRIETSTITIERVRSVSSVDYAIAIGQRRYANNVKLNDVIIEDAGADGIDVKNRLSRTEIEIRNVEVNGLGRNKPHGKDGAEVHWSKAAIDLRGRCVVRDIRIVGLDRGAHGLRFRQGERGVANGPGADGSQAHNVRIEAGTAEGVGLSVYADDVKLEGLEIVDTSVAVISRGQNLVIVGGKIINPGRYALVASPLTSLASMAMQDITFRNPREIGRRGAADVVFDSCRFEACDGDTGILMASLAGCEVRNCTFDESCEI